VGIDAQQAPDEAQEFRLAAAVNLLRITESAGKPAVLPQLCRQRRRRASSWN
jgi:hypothetical protein